MYGIQYTRDGDEITGIQIIHKTKLEDIHIVLPIDDLLKSIVIEKAIILDQAIQNKFSLASDVDKKTKEFNLAWANAFESIFGKLYSKINSFLEFPATGFTVNFDKNLEGKVRINITGIPVEYKEKVIEIVKDNFKICKKEGE